MNDGRMISQTSTVSSLCSADCSKYVREGQWRRVSEEEWMWSLMLAGSSCCYEAKRERENACSVMLTGLSCSKSLCERESLCSIMLASLSCCLGAKREGVCSLTLAGLSMLLAREEAKRGREMVSAAYYIAPGRWPGQNGISHSHWTKCVISNLQRPKQFPHKIIIWNSFCHTHTHTHTHIYIYIHEWTLLCHDYPNRSLQIALVANKHLTFLIFTVLEGGGWGSIVLRKKILDTQNCKRREIKEKSHESRNIKEQNTNNEKYIHI